MLSKATIAHTKQRFVVLFENLSVCESKEINEEYLENILIFITEKCWGLETKEKKISKSIWMHYGKIIGRGHQVSLWLHTVGKKVLKVLIQFIRNQLKIFHLEWNPNT